MLAPRRPSVPMQPDAPTSANGSGGARRRVRCLFLSRYRRLSENRRMIFNALAGVALGYVTYAIVYALIPFEPRATTSWFIAFAIGILRQHAIHRWLTFADRVPYWPSLRRAFVLDSSVLVLSTAMNWLLTVALGLDHRLAWLACLLVMAVFGLVFLKRYVFAVALPEAAAVPGGNDASRGRDVANRRRERKGKR